VVGRDWRRECAVQVHRGRPSNGSGRVYSRIAPVGLILDPLSIDGAKVKQGQGGGSSRAVSDAALQRLAASALQPRGGIGGERVRRRLIRRRQSGDLEEQVQ
jgi:hypothetical protein